MTKTPLQKAIEAEPFCGSQRAFALALGTSQQNINNWVRKGKQLPVELVPKAALISGIPAHEWRPDLPHLFTPVAA